MRKQETLLCHPVLHTNLVPWYRLLSTIRLYLRMKCPLAMWFYGVLKIILGLPVQVTFDCFERTTSIPVLLKKSQNLVIRHASDLRTIDRTPLNTEAIGVFYPIFCSDCSHSSFLTAYRVDQYWRDSVIGDCSCCI